jgi:hypothetical protein
MYEGAAIRLRNDGSRAVQQYSPAIPKPRRDNQLDPGSARHQPEVRPDYAGPRGACLDLDPNVGPDCGPGLAPN